MSTDMFLVTLDRWVPQRYFDTRAEADKYRDYCAKNYQGFYSVQRVSADYPRRFDAAVAQVAR